jgi:glycosyltransferase involved in cell wall biosynthesis
MKNLAAKNKIAFITSSYYPSLGGVEKHVQRVAEILASRGCIVKVFVRYKENYPKYQKINNVDIYSMPKKDGRPNINLWYLKNKKHFKDSVIHSHDYFPFSLRRLVKNRWVHTFHGFEGYPVSKIAIESRKRVLTSVDYSFCVGKFIEKWYGTKCDEILWGAADKPKKYDIKPKYDFVFFGRLEKDTGINAYLEAFKIMSNKNKSLKMLVVGWGSLQDSNTKYAMENNLDVEFRKPVKDVYAVLAESKIAFVSGYQAIIESALMRKPIIAYYDNPLKKDYLEMHPMVKHFSVVKKSKDMPNIVSKINKNSEDLKIIQQWALMQNWESLCDKYLKSY